MFDLMLRMLSIIDRKDIKRNKNLQILSGIHRIPTSVGEVLKQNKIK